jgi:hypothetical protein
MLQERLEEIKKRINSFFNDEKINYKFNNVLKKIHYPEQEKLEEYSITQIIDLRKKQEEEFEKIENKFYSETQEINNSKICKTGKNKKRKKK